MAHRIERINNLLRREISELVQHQLKDPRLNEFISITGVETSPDLKYAKVFVSCIHGKQEEETTIGVLTAASGHMRRELSKLIKLRYIPELSFHWDDSIEKGDRILRLIDELHQDDSP